MIVHRPMSVLVLGLTTAALLPAFRALAEPEAPRKEPAGVRRPVKNGTDADAGRVNATPVKTTIEKLSVQPRPPQLQSNDPNPEDDQHRFEPVETTVWEVEAEVVAYQLMPDGDFRVVLKGESGKQLVVEMPDPKLAGPKSRWAKELTAARKVFDDKFHPTRELQEGHARLRLQGVGHFGKLFTRGAEKNLSGVRLQPVLKIDWLPEAAPEKPGK